MSRAVPGVRYAQLERETRETRVEVTLDLDGGERRDVATGVAFFDHMLAQLAFHGRLNLGVVAKGDLDVDDHHTVEDVGIVLGQAVAEALGEEEDIVRYASNHTPMDEALVLCALDVSGRGVLRFDVPFRREALGDMATEAVREFFHALAVNGGLTLHLRKLDGENDHHVCEAAFKAVGRALHEATRRAEGRKGGSSTKGRRGA